MPRPEDCRLRSILIGFFGFEGRYFSLCRWLFSPHSNIIRNTISSADVFELVCENSVYPRINYFMIDVVVMVADSNHHFR